MASTPRANCSTGRPRGSRDPQRIRNDWLEQLLDECTRRSNEELVLALSIVANERFRRDSRTGEADRAARTKLRIIRALLDVEVLLVQQGERLTTTAQYVDHCGEDAPAISTIYHHFGSFDAARRAAWLAGRYPSGALLRRLGRGTNTPDFTDEDCVLAMAEGFNFFLGRRFSQRDYDRDFRGSDAPITEYVQLPSSETICAHSSHKGGPGSWDEMRERAVAQILANPTLYPDAEAFLRNEVL